MECLPKHIIILICDILVTQKTQTTMASFLALGCTSRRLASIVFGDDCVRYLCEYEPGVTRKVRIAAVLKNVLTVTAMDEAWNRHGRWLRRFEMRYRRRCIICARLIWIDQEDVCPNNRSGGGSHSFPPKSEEEEVVLEALKIQDQLRNEFVSDSRKEQAHLLMNFDVAKFDRYVEKETLQSSQDWGE